MSKVINKWWFTTFGGHCIAIIKTLDEITGEEKFRIGIGEGLDEEIDALTILNCGDKFFPEVIK